MDVIKNMAKGLNIVLIFMLGVVIFINFWLNINAIVVFNQSLEANPNWVGDFEQVTQSMTSRILSPYPDQELNGSDIYKLTIIYIRSNIIWVIGQSFMGVALLKFRSVLPESYRNKGVFLFVTIGLTHIGLFLLFSQLSGV